MPSQKNELENIKIKKGHLNPFQFDKFEENYLLTNDFGYYIFLTPKDFKDLLEDKIEKKTELFKELDEKGFIRRDLSEYESLNKEYRSLKSSLFSGPTLHIIVTTLRCNQGCVYCQASSRKIDSKNFDMDIETARKTVDRIFETPSNSFVIEFQGGEPLINWNVVRFVVDYAREKEKTTGKSVHFSLVTNFLLMNEKRLDFLADRLVGICTSLDGPRELHNQNRPCANGIDSYQETVKWIKKYEKKWKEVQKEGKNLTRINALVTISKQSLEYPKEIIDEYIELGFSGLHLRPLSYLGYSSGFFKKEKIGYTAEEFMDFWIKGMDYIIDLNNQGKVFFERGAVIMLQKIIARKDPGYTDLSSPCGAVRGQVLYNYDGNVYTCDEGRMTGDDAFKVGNVYKETYEDIIGGETAQAVIAASILENQSCDTCVYKPYCGVCPVMNYSGYGTLFPQIRNTDWCKLKMGQFEYIFKKLEEQKYRRVFKDWVLSPHEE